MEYRDIKDINKDLDNVDSILFKLKKSYMDDPNDLGIKTNIMVMESQKRDLIRELGFTKNNLGITSFDFHISNVEGGKINLDSLSDVSGAIQELINSCSMFDGTHPVKKGSSTNVEVTNNVTLQVDAVETGSLILFVSSKEKQASLENESYLKRGLNNINNIISCGDDKNKLFNVMENMGSQPLFKYKELLKILSNDNLNLDLYSSVMPKGFKTQKISNDFAKKVYNVFNETETPKQEEIELTGKLYYINSKSKNCGIEFKDKDSGKLKTINLKFMDSFKSNLKNKLYEQITVLIKRTEEHNIFDEDDNKPWELVKIY